MNRKIPKPIIAKAADINRLHRMIRTGVDAEGYRVTVSAEAPAVFAQLHRELGELVAIWLND